jgi:hypothetical protein
MSPERIIAHAVLGCVQQASSGGQCGPGAAAAAFGKIASGLTQGLGEAAQFAVTTVVGGTVSVIGGGKFANGAAQAGFGYLFNEVGRTKMNRQGYTGSPADLPEDKNFKLVASEPPEFVGQVGGQVQYTLGPIYYSVDMSVAVNSTLGQMCFVIAERSGLGVQTAPLSLSGGISAQGQTGPLVPGRSESRGVYWFGGSGLRGEGQFLGNQHGRGIIGLGTPAAGGGVLVCTQNNTLCSGNGR